MDKILEFDFSPQWKPFQELMEVKRKELEERKNEKNETKDKKPAKIENIPLQQRIEVSSEKNERQKIPKVEMTKKICNNNNSSGAKKDETAVTRLYISRCSIA